MENPNNIMNRDFEKNELALIKPEQDMFELSVSHQTSWRYNRVGDFEQQKRVYRFN